MKGCSDEMQMSLSDFEFAVKLPRKKNKLEYESDLEQVVKTALLWIEEDLSFRHGGSPVEINSQTLFSDGYVQEKTGDAAFRKKYKQPFCTNFFTEEFTVCRLIEYCFAISLWQQPSSNSTILYSTIKSVSDIPAFTHISW